MSGVPEGSVSSIPFKDRHPILSGIPEGSFPRSIGLSVNPTSTQGFHSLMTSVLNTAYDFAGSPTKDIYALMASTNEMFSSYSRNFLEGYLSTQVPVLQAGRVAVKWEGPKPDPRSVVRINRAVRETARSANLTLHLVFNKRQRRDVDLMVEPTQEQRVLVDQNRIVTFSVFKPDVIDTAIVKFVNPNSTSA